MEDEDVEDFVDRLRADESLYERVLAAVVELVGDDPEVPDEELGWAAVDLASATTEVPDDAELDRIGELLRQHVDGAH